MNLTSSHQAIEKPRHRKTHRALFCGGKNHQIRLGSCKKMNNHKPSTQGYSAFYSYFKPRIKKRIVS